MAHRRPGLPGVRGRGIPYDAPPHIREALGIRSVWPAIRHAPVNFTIDELPRYAEELADPDLSLAELCVWHWWEKNGLQSS